MDMIVEIRENLMLLLTLICTIMATKNSQAAGSLSRNRTCNSAKPVIVNDVESSSMRSKRDISRLVVGMVAILLALANLAFYTFGQEQSALLTAGATASIATSLILALAGFSVLRS